MDSSSLPRGKHRQGERSFIIIAALCRILLMHLLTAFLPSLLLITLGAQAGKATTVNARCLLVIDGRTHMNGPCKFTNVDDSDFFTDGRLLITCPDGQDASKSSCYGYQQKVSRKGVFGYLYRQPTGSASLCWNEGTGRKADPCFEGLRRNGACWINSSARSRVEPTMVSSVRFCAWAS